MKVSLIWKKLNLDGREFVGSEALHGMCRDAGKGYDDAVAYLLRKGYLVRVFRGTFYVRGPDELDLGRVRYDPLGLVARGLAFRGIGDWYFGLETALKLNGMTYEYFAREYVISATFRRTKPVAILDREFEFLRWKRAVVGFGVVAKGPMRYSDREKTLLDMAYLRLYHGMSHGAVVRVVSEYADAVSKGKLKEYAASYPRSVRDVAEGLA